MRPSLPVCILMAACGAPDLGAPVLSSTAYNPHPQTPEILRDVSLIDDDAQFTQPFVPGHRTTMDGRVAVRVQGGPPGPERVATSFSFFLFAPEKLTEPILPGPPGAEILATTEPFDVVFPPALAPGVTRLGHHAICDPTPELPGPDDRPNPYTCGPAGAHDCYDLTILSSTSPGLSMTLWGTPVTVEVEQPKTAQARIVRAEIGEPVRGTTIPTANEWTEPAITQDGRLLTGRLGRFPRAWTNPETGETLVRPYDLAYSLLPDGVEPCDVTGWVDFHPMSHAPYDPAMVGHYGLAAYPFRDSEGNAIPDGEDMGGTYPWVDREGANVFMTGVPGRIAEQSPTAYPRRCVQAGCEAFAENVDWDRGFMVGGLWTHGRFVHLDGMINNVDWAVGVTPAAHYLVDLYQDDAGEPVSVRLGAGRFIDSVRDAGGPYPAGYTHNANILDSLEHLANHQPHARPVTARDIVWVMSSGVATDEIAFDDFLDPNALIVSNMQASITQRYTPQGASMSIPHHHNGQVWRVVAENPIQIENELMVDETEDIHLQNAATSLAWRVPAFGLVEAGTARVEPTALGGVHGRGFWLSGDTRIRYDVPAQDRPLDDIEVYVGLFVDPRTPDGETRSLLRFPDGSALLLSGHATVSYVREGRVWHEVELPPSDGWMHLGLSLRDGFREVTLSHDGYPFDRFVSKEAWFQPTEGAFVVGRDEEAWTGFRGWIDDLVVLAHVPDVEVACNHAGGTLIDVGEDPTWSAVSAGYPPWAHEAVASAAGVQTGSFACFHDHSADNAAHLANVPAGTTSLRAGIHFPEGPLRAGVPRPDSTSNAFCLSCHTAEGKGGLTLDALVLKDGVAAEDDRRRQPSQPPPRVFGNVPAGWIAPGAGPGSPTTALQAPALGLPVDVWLMPPAP